MCLKGFGNAVWTAKTKLRQHRTRQVTIAYLVRFVRHIRHWMLQIREYPNNLIVSGVNVGQSSLKTRSSWLRRAISLYNQALSRGDRGLYPMHRLVFIPVFKAREVIYTSYSISTPCPGSIAQE